ncbi:MAG: LysR substrate-binding domain-containing protein [Burkholderiales bacterium]
MLTSVPRPLRLPLNTLPAFRAVAELANLRAAADVLHLTHSAVSQQIRSLETQIGFPLFDRRGRRVVLNAGGEALLRSVQAALATLDEGVQAAAAAAGGAALRLRVTVLPSFAQRWLLPRINRWRARHPDIALEIDASQQVVDLARNGFHAAVRYGKGPWAGLVSERLFTGPVRMIAVGAPETARRLAGAGAAALAREPLLGDAEWWATWLSAAGVRAQPRPVAVFNDAGLMLQAAEQGIGIALARELLAADALADGRLVRLSPLAVELEPARTYQLVYPPGLRDSPPLVALRQWMQDEIERSRAALRADRATARAPKGTRRPSRTRSRP